MTSGWGVDATLNGSGVVTSGTTAADVRKVWGGLYSPGIVTGCTVSTSASAMQYTVTSGLVAIKTSTGEIIMAPVQGKTITAPAATNRTEIIWARQKFPAEGSSDVEIESGTVLPPNSVALKRYVVTAGQTNTNAAVQSGGIDYSIPYGSSLGILHQHRNTDNTWFTASAPFGTKAIYLPTDRLVRVSLLTCVSAASAEYCEAGFDFKLDGVKKWKWNTTVLSNAWATYFWSDTLVIPAGQHTVSYDRYRAAGTGNPWHHYVAGDASGSLFTVEDIGPSV